VAFAVGADDFGASAVGVGQGEYGVGQLVVEAGPAALGVELGGGVKEDVAALFAGVGAFFEVAVILAGEGCFGAFLEDDVGFLWGEFFVHGRFLVEGESVEVEVGGAGRACGGQGDALEAGGIEWGSEAVGFELVEGQEQSLPFVVGGDGEVVVLVVLFAVGGSQLDGEAGSVGVDDE